MAITAVSDRIKKRKDIVPLDLLAKLLESRNAEGKPSTGRELTVQPVTLLLGGSDTTSKYALLFGH